MISHVCLQLKTKIAEEETTGQPKSAVHSQAMPDLNLEIPEADVLDAETPPDDDLEVQETPRVKRKKPSSADGHSLLPQTPACHTSDERLLQALSRRAVDSETLRKRLEELLTKSPDTKYAERMDYGKWFTDSCVLVPDNLWPQFRTNVYNLVSAATPPANVAAPTPSMSQGNVSQTDQFSHHQTSQSQSQAASQSQAGTSSGFDYTLSQQYQNQNMTQFNQYSNNQQFQDPYSMPGAWARSIIGGGPQQTSSQQSSQGLEGAGQMTPSQYLNFSSPALHTPNISDQGTALTSPDAMEDIINGTLNTSGNPKV